MHHSNRRTRKTEATRGLLKNAFVELVLQDNQAEAITVSEIAEQADFNRGTFYTHYQDKIDLLEDLYTDALEGIRQSYVEPYKNMDRALIKDDDPSVSLIFKHIEKHKNLFQALDIIGGDPGIYNRLEEFLWNLFTKEIELEKHADATDIEYEILLSFQIHATLGVIKYWIKQNFVYSADHMTEQMTTLYKSSVAAMSFKRIID